MTAVIDTGDDIDALARSSAAALAVGYHRGAPPGASGPRGRDYPTGWRLPPTADGPCPIDADPGGQGFAVPDLPQRPSLEYLRKQAKKRKRARGIGLSQAQHEVAREHGFDSWPRLVHHVQASGLDGVERALTLADATTLATLLRADTATANVPVDGLAPLLMLLRRSIGTPADVRGCVRLLLDAGVEPDAHTLEWGGEGRRSALFDAVERGDAALVRLLLEYGATSDEDAFYHACEQSDTALLDLLYRPGFQRLVIHKLDFEDAAGLRWFLDRGADVNAQCCLHHAIVRGRGVRIIEMLLNAGADVDQPWTRWDVGRRPLALAARSGHLAAYELLAARGATADLDPVDAAVLAVARGESVRLPDASPPAKGQDRKVRDRHVLSRRVGLRGCRCSGSPGSSCDLLPDSCRRNGTAAA
jgi:hypothetical protein